MDHLAFIIVPMSGQTLRTIRSLLEKAGLKPRHRFGQHFLIDLNLMRKMVRVAGLVPDDVVLDVGAGTGSLTEMLLETGCRVIANELDRDLYALLEDRFAGRERLTLLPGDCLAGKHRLNPQLAEALASHAPGPGGVRKLVANLPYSVATPLIMELLYFEPPVERMVFTIQKEVGQRLMAAPGSADYGPISVVAQSLAQMRSVATLPAGVFWPRPKVDSVMIDLRRNPPERIPVDDPREFGRFVQKGFLHRRKVLRHACRHWELNDPAAFFAAAGVSDQQRPQDLPPAAWWALFAAWRQDRRRQDAAARATDAER